MHGSTLLAFFYVILRSTFVLSKCEWPSLSRNVYFGGMDPCSLRESHGWVSFLPFAMKARFSNLAVYAHNISGGSFV